MKKDPLQQQTLILLQPVHTHKPLTAKLLLCLLLITGSIISKAQSINLTGPGGSGTFGSSVTVLSNGNYVITDPSYDDGAVTDAGAVYLYNGSSHTLISTLKGSTANDQVGSGGIIAVGSSNFLVRSGSWNNGAAISAGAVTWVNGTTGLSGVVNSTNSLVGSTASDNISNVGVGILSNGNYVVVSSLWDNGAATNAGAATWGNGNSGVSGIISSSNSLVGNKTNDNVSGSGILVLTNGNYVIRSTAWDNGAATDAGAVTWGNGTTGTTGVVSSTNSLVGSTANDNIGSLGVALSNGNYVTTSFSWNNGAIVDAGAATWGNGTTGITGAVSSSNSLVGSTASDQIASNMVALPNGNYVLQSSSWDNGATVDAGAATWCNGTTGRTGTISSSNSLIGASTSDRVSLGNITALTNGNYVVRSFLFDNGAVVNAGAMTWCNGSTGRTGFVSSSNSLTSNMPSDQIGDNVTQLANGNYVVGSGNWDNGVVANAGAVTWCSGTAGTTGPISSSNSLVGSQLNDQVGNSIVVALSNGNYVVPSGSWDNGAAVDAGAATWCNGSTGTTGVVSSSNSLVGTQLNDGVGSAGVVALTNGNYVVRSTNWKNGAAVVGAATWANGTTGITGVISPANSLVGSTTLDNISSGGITPLTNGNYVVCSSAWDNGAIANVGAATWGNGTTGTTGTVSSSNSLVGAVANDQFGFNGATALTNGNYVARSVTVDNGAITEAGAVAWGNGTVGTTGIISSSNALIGSSNDDFLGATGIIALSTGNYIIRSNNYDNGVLNSGAVSFGNGSAGLSGLVTSCNSIRGNVVSGGSTMIATYNPVYDYTIVRRPNENIVTIFLPTGMSLANSLDSVSVTMNGPTAVPLIANTGCRLIATLTATGATAIKDSVHTKVWIESSVPVFAMLPFVARHFEITPTNNATTATGRLTLYFTQPEFDDFNSHPNSFWNLPANSADALGKSHVRIACYEGTSSDRSGLPGSYTPGAVVIDPNDADIIWNSSLSRWEISFDVTGFGGFVLQTALYPLAVSVQFSGQLQNNNALLNWKTAHEAGVDVYVLERSTDGSSYSAIYQSAAFNTNGDHQYRYTDNNIDALNAGVIYYRIKQVNIDGSYSYSQIVALSPAGKNIVLLYPNPATDITHVMITVSKAQQISYRVIDNTGRSMMVQKQRLVAGSNSLPVDVSKLAPGMYWVELSGEFMKERKPFIKK